MNDKVTPSIAGSNPAGLTPQTPSPGTDWVAQLQGEGVKIGIFILALVLVAFGFYLLFTKQVNSAGKKLAKTAVKAALL